ncbi:MAG TPA: cysteine peptidase family C39 domain-containing protein [Blastocatellia bacterium]|nr:cysteine peptidase family C39 domain-containing protein [Blastocatellia bacterium]
MTLSSLGLDLPEADLRDLCDCTFEGTDALKAVDAARQLGFAKTAKHTLSLEELAAVVAGGKYPIVYVDLRPIEGNRAIHALVVLEVSPDTVNVYDPAQGELSLSCQIFSIAWRMQHNLTIVIEK